MEQFLKEMQKELKDKLETANKKSSSLSNLTKKIYKDEQSIYNEAIANFLKEHPELEVFTNK